MDPKTLFVPLQILFNVFFLMALLALARERFPAAASGEEQRPGAWARLRALLPRRRRRRDRSARRGARGEKAAREALDRLLERTESRDRGPEAAGGAPSGLQEERPAVADLKERIERFRRERQDGGRRAG